LSSLLISKNVRITIYKTEVLPVAFYRCGTGSLTREKIQIEGVSEQGTEENIWT
jgi:hypothetical protein